MNKIYRTVYNETTGTWVAVEETAKSHRKSAGVVNESVPAREVLSGSLKKFSIAAAVVAMVSPTVSTTAQADVLCRGANNQVFSRTGPTCDGGETLITTFRGSNSTVSGTNTAVVAGTNNKVYSQNSVAWGSGVTAGNSANNNVYNATAWGSTTQATASRATAFGQTTKATGEQSTAFGANTQATAQNATAFGSSTQATQGQATAFGSSTKATNWRATAFGEETTADGSNATTFGKKTLAKNGQATAFGEETNAGVQLQYNGENVTPFRQRLTLTNDAGEKKEQMVWVLLDKDGNLIKAPDRDSSNLDYGYAAEHKSDDYLFAFNYSTLMGGIDPITGNYRTPELSKGKADDSDNATAFGKYSIAVGGQATAFGFRAAATAENATAWGHETLASAKRATAFGINTEATGKNSTAFGNETHSTNENTTAWGSKTRAEGIGSTAWGSHTRAAGDNSTTWGKESEVFAGELTHNGVTYTDVRLQNKQIATGGGSNGLSPYNFYYVVGTDPATGEVVLLAGDAGEDYSDTPFDGVTPKVESIASGLWSTIQDGVDEIDVRQKVKEWIGKNNGSLAGDYSTAFGNSSKVYAENALGALGGTVGEQSSNAGANSAAIGVGSLVKSDNA